ncbi:MAG: cation diffusion facilitator family transporter [Deferribacteraceae bacterium]|jgi:cation diffusion facilitator family transporter|nr:cation diffusion facilitator family transporter [Deferribacteraceae bacterium]
MKKLKAKLTKRSAPKLVIALATMLAILKAVVGFASGSLAVLSSAVDSLMDVLASSLNYVLIRAADEPPDKEHNFGHGKFESYASFLQSVLIFASGVYLFVEACRRLYSSESMQISSLAGLVMLVSIVVSLVIVLLLRSTARREASPALKADAAHYAMDLLTNSGVLVALIIIKLTGLVWIDAAIALVLSVYIMYSALKIHIAALRVILDMRVPESELQEITAVLDKYSAYFKNYHRLRARTDGYKIFVDLHLLLCNELTLGEAHALCDIIEQEMPAHIDLTIHPEPVDMKKIDANIRWKVQALLNEPK